MKELFDLYIVPSFYRDGVGGWVHPRDSKFERIRGKSYRSSKFRNGPGSYYLTITELQYNSELWLRLHPEIKSIIDQIKIDLGDT